MSIRAVDMQTILPRAPEVAKTANIEGDKQALTQHQQTVVSKEETRKNLTQVHTRSKTEEARIKERYDRERRNGKKKKSPIDNYDLNKKVEDEEEVEVAPEKPRRSTIDIRI